MISRTTTTVSAAKWHGARHSGQTLRGVWISCSSKPITRGPARSSSLGRSGSMDWPACSARTLHPGFRATCAMHRRLPAGSRAMARVSTTFWTGRRFQPTPPGIRRRISPRALI
ncbi:MAG: hypothetical protein LJE68_17150 [Rhodobacter sp.]|nr:hypothetical protein [Rhodobacter sp.]